MNEYVPDRTDEPGDAEHRRRGALRLAEIRQEQREAEAEEAREGER